MSTVWELNDAKLQAYLATIDQIAQRHGEKMELELQPPASPDALKLVETYMSVPLAKSQRDFLLGHDGMSISVADFYRLEIYGAGQIIRQTEDLRNYLDLLGDGSPPYGRENVRRFFDIVGMFQTIDRRILCDVDSPAGDGEYRISYAWMDDDHTWLWSRPDPDDTYFVSDSFASFVKRSLEHMIDTERGFAYWNPELDSVLW
jgi:hypothetical protein